MPGGGRSLRHLTAPRPASSSIWSGSKIGEATTGPSGTSLHEAIRSLTLIAAAQWRLVRSYPEVSCFRF